MISNTELSIVVPVLNEEAVVQKHLAQVREVAPNAELIVVDGGSEDSTCDIAANFADEVISADPGRACQMNAGAKRASGNYILFLHADTFLPSNFYAVFQEWQGTAPIWGHLKLRLSGEGFVFRVIETMINLRTKITDGVTGDQCQIVRADAFRDIGEFPNIPLLEDLALSKRLQRVMPSKILPVEAISSSRRWEERGVLRTIVLMWVLRIAYTLGVHPRYFSKSYRLCP